MQTGAEGPDLFAAPCAGTDFVRGYPFSLREGVPTAVSHGLWLNVPDYDAATQVQGWHRGVN